MTLSLEARACHWPDRSALVDVDANADYTYAALASAVERATGRLAAAGVEPGDRLAVLAPNSAWLVCQLFAARRRGATLAPISHRLASGTIETLLDRVDPELVVYDEALAASVETVSQPTRTVEALRSTSPVGDTDGTSAAAPLFLHTGGTTGVPKVVPISDRQLEYNAITESVAWGLDEATVSVPVLPLFHTGGWNLLTLPTLYAGGTVVLPRAFDPGETLSLIESHGATQFFAVAAILRAMADHPAFETTDFTSVDWFMSGGGPCPDAVIEAYRDRDQTILQGYGLTEGGPNNLYYSPERATDTPKPDSVGRPFPDVSARLVDADGGVLTGAATGELEFRGPVTAAGYLDTSDGTFGDADSAAGERPWVSTGDLARRDEDGDYYIVGRTDNMFVSGGENVSPEAIEATLERHDAVEAVGVVPMDHERWGQVPLAFVVGDADTATLEAFADEHLADFQRPREWVRVSELPETGAGKLDREALAERVRE